MPMKNLKNVMNEKRMTVSELKAEVNQRREKRGDPHRMTEHTIYGVLNNNKNWTRESITDIADVLDHEIEIVKKKAK